MDGLTPVSKEAASKPTIVGSNPAPATKQDNTLLLFLLSGLVPIGTFALWTDARLVINVAWYPFVLASFASVAIDRDLLLRHERTIYLRYITVKQLFP